jgi:hypothetical protein
MSPHASFSFSSLQIKLVWFLLLDFLPLTSIYVQKKGPSLPKNPSVLVVHDEVWTGGIGHSRKSVWVMV